MIEISKELLSEVIGKEIREFAIEKNELRYILEDDNNSIPELYYINIYELAHKCKEWAFDSFYLSIITFKINDDLYKCEIADIKDSLGEWSNKYSFRIDNEIKAIFKACEWILDNEEKIK